MNLKNINKFNLIIFSLFFLSCQSIDFLNNKEQQLISTIFEEIEPTDRADNIQVINLLNIRRNSLH